MFIKTTRHIKVTATPHYLEEHSVPEDEHFVWAYSIHLENHGDETVQLLRRHWHITDGLGMVQEVRGDGVVGEQPVLKAGESYRYTSGTALTTPTGIMRGEYAMTTSKGEEFEVTIPAFSLDSPQQLQRPN